MCTNEEELYKRAEWNGKGSLSRQKLMDRLQCELLFFYSLRTDEEAIYTYGIENYIQDRSNVFSMSSQVKIYRTSFPSFSLMFMQAGSQFVCMYNKKKITWSGFKI